MKRVIFSSLMLTILALPAWAADAVPDADAAIKIAAEALKAKIGEKSYSDLMKDKEWKADTNGVVWNVYPTLRPESQRCSSEPGKECVVVQLGGLMVRIIEAIETGMLAPGMPIMMPDDMKAEVASTLVSFKETVAQLNALIDAYEAAPESSQGPDAPAT